MKISCKKNQITYMTTDLYTQAIGKENIDMDMAYNSIKTDQSTMETGITIKKTDKALLITPTVIFMMVDGKTIWQMGMGFIQLCTVTDSRAIGKII